MSSSSETLRDHLNSIHQISILSDRLDSHILEEKIHENLELKEKIIALESELKIIKETNDLQAAEHAFQRSEYESEIGAAKKVEVELRNALLQASRNKTDVVHDIEERFKSQISDSERSKNEFLQALQLQVTRLRNKVVDIQAENEIMKEDYSRTKQQNTDLLNHLNDQEAIYTSKIQLLEKHIAEEKENHTTTVESLRSTITELEKGRADLLNDLMRAQRRIDELESQAEVSSQSIALKDKQISEMKQENGALSSKLSDVSAQHGKLTVLNETLQNRIDVLETEIKTVNRMMARMEDTAREIQAVSYCSPLQRTRIDFLKLIEKNHDKLVKQAYDVYPDCKYKESELRPLILAVLFTHRWRECTGNPTEICDHREGLVPFSSRLVISPKQLLINAKNDIVAYEDSLRETQQKIMLLDQECATAKSEKVRVGTNAQAISLQLAAARKHNKALHRQIKSFIEFHNAMTEDQE